MVEIEWKLERRDEGEEEPRKPVSCLLEITGKVRRKRGGAQIGEVTGFYVHADRINSELSFWELWDIDARSCEVFLQIRIDQENQLRDPLPSLLRAAPGILYVESIVLQPPFRRQGLGREVMRETVRACADRRIGAVLLKSEPLQYAFPYPEVSLPEYAGLPTDNEERDRLILQEHFRSWGLQLIPQTTFMVAEPAVLSPESAASWPPVPIHDGWNTCVHCGKFVDRTTENWEESEDGFSHRHCE